MKQPKQWNDLMLKGYVTTDMIDGCVLYTHANYLRWQKHAKSAKRTLKKKPKSEAAQRRYKYAILKTNEYLTMREQLLDILKPVAAVILIRKQHANAGYLIYTIGDHRYLQHKEIPTLKRTAEKYQLQVQNVDSIHCPSYELGNIPSHALVNKVLRTIYMNKLRYAIDNGSFNPTDSEWEPKPVLTRNCDPDKLVPIGKLNAEFMNLAYNN